MDLTSHRRERVAALVRTALDAPEQLLFQVVTRAAVVTTLVLVLTIAPQIHAARDDYALWLHQETEQAEAFVMEWIAIIEAWARSIREERQ